MTTDTASTDLRRPLRRLPRHGMLAGVAAGVADRFDLDPTLVRVGIVALCLFGGTGVPLYLAAWLLVPEEGADRPLAEDLLERVGAR